MAEHLLAMQKVVGSNPIARSTSGQTLRNPAFVEKAGFSVGEGFSLDGSGILTSGRVAGMLRIEGSVVEVESPLAIEIADGDYYKRGGS